MRTSLSVAICALLIAAASAAIGAAIGSRQCASARGELAERLAVTDAVASMVPTDAHDRIESWRDVAHRELAAQLARAIAGHDDLTAMFTFRAGSDGALTLVLDPRDAGAQKPHPSALRCAATGIPTSAHAGTDTLACAPLRDASGTVRGVLCALWVGTPGAAPTSAVATTVAWLVVLAAIAVVVGHLWIGRPLRRIARLLRCPGGVRATVAAVEESVLERTHLVARLESRVRVRTQELEQRAHVKDEFLANTAHELRTPLTTIVATLDMLDGDMLTTDAERRTFVEQARSASSHMLFLLNDLLDTAAFEAGKLRIDCRACSTRELLDAARRILAPMAAVRSISLEVCGPDADESFVGDPMRALQVVFNLVGNALKYSPQHTTVVLHAEARGERVQFRVEDRGFGVPPAARTSLFTRFGRIHGADQSSVTGTGIGLYMSKVLIESMGGAIGHVARDDGPGSVFWFELPRAVGAGVDAGVAAPASHRA